MKAWLLVVVGLIVPRIVLADSAEVRAARHVESAIRLYKKGAYVEAGEHFLSAYELSKRPLQLRNAAKAFEEGGDNVRALELWKRYRALQGLSEQQLKEADVHIARDQPEKTEPSEKQEETAPTEPPREVPPVATTSTADQPPSSPSIAVVDAPVVVRSKPIAREERVSSVPPYVIAGAGVVVLLTSGVLWETQSSALDELNTDLNRRDNQGHILGIDYSSYKSKVDTINRERVAAGITGIIGAALLAVGATWLILQLIESD